MNQVSTGAGVYDVEEKIASRDSGEVYRAFDRRLKRTVALSAIRTAGNDSALRRFMHESQAASILQHPNIGSVYSIDQDQSGALWVVGEWYDGESLSDLIARGPAPHAEVLRIGIAVAEGLAAAHEHGVVHRDLKPSNILLTHSGGVKIVDFGAARLMQDDERLTSSRPSMGTVAYMAPEQLHGESADPRSDVWALGVVLYDMAAGRHPFPGSGFAEQAHAVLNQDPQPLVSVPPELTRVISKALAKDPADRYSSGAEFAAALREAANGADKPLQSQKAISGALRRLKALFQSADRSDDPASEATDRGSTPSQTDPEVELVRRAADIIGSDRLPVWMQTPVRSLQGRTPYSLIGTEEGRRQVETVLGRIAQGIY